MLTTTASAARPKADRRNVRTALWAVAVSIGPGLIVWLVAPGVLEVVLPSGESAAVHSADGAFVYKNSRVLGMIAVILTIGAVAIVLLPAVATAGLDARGGNSKHAMSVILTVSVIVSAVTLFHTFALVLGKFDDRGQQTADSFVSWAETRYGVDLAGVPTDDLESLYASKDGFSEIRNPDTGDFIVSYTDSRGTVLVKGADEVEEPPVKN